MSMAGEELEMGMETKASPELLPKFLFTALPDGGVAWSDSSGYAIKVADRDGRVQRVLTRDLKVRPVTGGVEGDYRAWLTRRLEGETDPEIAELQRRRIEALDFHSEVPQVDGLRATWEGTLWILRTSPTTGGRGARTKPGRRLFPLGGELLQLKPPTPRPSMW